MVKGGELRKTSETVVPSEEARRRLPSLITRARYYDDLFVITRHGEEHAALIGLEDLALLRKIKAA